MDDLMKGNVKHTFDVFISYRHRNQRWLLDSLIPNLERAGIRY